MNNGAQLFADLDDILVAPAIWVYFSASCLSISGTSLRSAFLNDTFLLNLLPINIGDEIHDLGIKEFIVKIHPNMYKIFLVINFNHIRTVELPP